MVRKMAITMVLLALGLSACSDKSKDEGEGLRGQSACLTTPSPIADPQFPTPFPSIGDVTWTSSNPAGPSRIVEGYTGDALTDLFNEMKEKFAEGGFKVEKAEHDPHDAEVNFTSDKLTGQVRLGEECQGRTSVTITIRPK